MRNKQKILPVDLVQNKCCCADPKPEIPMSPNVDVKNSKELGAIP